MLFEKDSFTKHLDQLKEHLSAAENIVSVIEYTETSIDTRALNQINKALESASSLLKRLYDEISTKKNSWDEFKLKQRQGDYENIVNRYKLIQQHVESFRANPKFIP
jgi:hypothetical protein